MGYLIRLINRLALLLEFQGLQFPLAAAMVSCVSSFGFYHYFHSVNWLHQPDVPFIKALGILCSDHIHLRGRVAGGGVAFH